MGSFYFYCLKRLVEFEPETRIGFCADCMKDNLSGYTSTPSCQNKNLEKHYNKLR